MGGGLAGEELVLVHNIPSELRSADLRAFFNEWVESNRFRCFHYQHRESPSQHAAPPSKAAAASPPRRCCLVRLSQKDTRSFIRRYNDQRWVRAARVGDAVELPARCQVRTAGAEDDLSGIPKSTMPAPGQGSEDGGYQTQRQKRDAARKGLTRTRGNTIVPRDLLPPPGLPQGNVGTPSKKLIELVSACVVPPVALKGLAVNLSSCGRGNRRQGEFNFDWKYIIGIDDDEDVEEWDRVEALEGPVPTHMNERADRLECDFQERTADALDVISGDADAECDWEAGTRDPDDVAHLEDLDNRKKMLALANGGGAFKRLWAGRPTALGLPPALRQGKSQAQALQSSKNDGDSLALAFAGVSRDDDPNACACTRGDGGGVSEKRTSRRSRVRFEEELGREGDRAGGHEDAFERDVRKGFAGKFCEKMGWKPGDGLGVKGDLGIVKGLVSSWLSVSSAAGMPMKSLKDSRRGIGFGGARGGGDSHASDQDAREESKGGGGSGEEGEAQRERGGVGEGGLGVDEKGSCGKRMHASRSLEDEVQHRIAEVDEDYFHIGCIYDRDAMALRLRQEQRVLDKGGPWLGSFDMDSMQGREDEVALDRGAAHEVPWWQDEVVEKHQIDTKRQRLVQKQLETNVFKRAGFLGLSTSRNPTSPETGLSAKFPSVDGVDV